MQSNGISGKQRNLWVLAALAAPLAQVAAGSTWLTVLLTGAGCGAACLVLQKMTDQEAVPYRWIFIVQWLWLGILMGQFTHWTMLCWPGYEPSATIPLILLLLAAWSASGGEERPSRVGNVIFWLLAILYGGVIASAVGGIEPNYLTELEVILQPMLIVIFLIPALSGWKTREIGTGALAGMIILGIALSLVTVGVLSYPVAASTTAPFYELSRSLTLLGIGERFESLTAAGMTLGYFVLFSFLMTAAGYAAERVSVKTRKWGVWGSAVLAAVILLSGIKISPWILMIGCVILWLVVPLGCNIFRKGKKRKKGEKNA